MEQTQLNTNVKNDVSNQQQPTSGRPAKGKVTFKAIIALIVSFLILLPAGFFAILLQLGDNSSSIIDSWIIYLYGLVLTLVVFVYARLSIFGKKRKATDNSGAPSTAVSPVIVGFWLCMCLLSIISMALAEAFVVKSIDTGFTLRLYILLIVLILLGLPLLFIVLWVYLMIKHWHAYQIRPGRILLGFLSCLFLYSALISVPFCYDYYLRQQSMNKYQEYKAQVEQRLQTDIQPKFMDFALWQSWDECDEVINNMVNSSVLEEGSRDDSDYNRISGDSIIYRYKIVKTAWKNMTIDVVLFGDKDKVFGIFVKNDDAFSDLGEEPHNMLSEGYGKPEYGYDLEKELEQNGVSEEDMPTCVDYDDVWRFKNCYICYEKHYGELLYIDSKCKLGAIDLRTTF